MKFYGKKGDVYEIPCMAAPLVEETHGWLFPVSGRPDLTAKLFHPDGLMGDMAERKEQNFRKLMGIWVPSDTLEYVLWPEDGLWDEEGRFRGYVRPGLRGYCTFGSIVRKQWSMDVDDKIHIAHQLIEAVKAVHRMDGLCGNLHRESILLSSGYEKLKLAGCEFFRFREEAGGYFSVNESVYRNPDTGFAIPRVPDDLAVANHLKKLFERQLLQMNLPHWERVFFLAFLNGMNNPNRRPQMDDYEELLEQLEEQIRKCKKE